MKKVLFVVALGIAGLVSANSIEEKGNGDPISKNMKTVVDVENENTQKQFVLSGGDSWFCQRKSGESTSGCFNRELKEFTSDAIGKIAYVTNGANINALITAMCNCSESSTPLKKTEFLEP